MIPLWWCRVAILGLILLQPVWFVAVSPPAYLPLALVLAMTLTPLLVVLPGVWHLKPRTLVIAGCLLLIYFSFAVMESWVHPIARWPALVQIALVALFFTALPAIRKLPDQTG